MNITYDIKDLPKRKVCGKKSEETLAIIAFLADIHKKNMCIEYDTGEECKRRYDTLRGYRNANKLQNVYDIYRIDKKIYVVKLKKSVQKDVATKTS